MNAIDGSFIGPMPKKESIDACTYLRQHHYDITTPIQLEKNIDIPMEFHKNHNFLPMTEK